MTGIAIRAFRGVVPRTSDRLLADNQATQALNCKITSGRLDPLKGLGLVHTSLAAAITTLFRYRHLTEYNWLVWDRVVDVARSPVAQDHLGRFFYTGDGEPRMSTYADAISGGGPYPASWFVLGVAPPVSAMIVAPTGGVSATNEDRAYVYTFATRYGEESGPSPATLITGKEDDTFDITGMDAAPPNAGSVTAAASNTPLPDQVEVTLDSVFGLAAFEEVTFEAVGGMTDLNGRFALVSVDAVANKVVVALATAQAYTAGGTWARRAPHNTTGMVKRIYRTIGTNTDYKFVAEIPVADTTFSDTLPSAVVSLNNGIPTLDVEPPPKDMHSIVLLANNALAGLSGNQLCLSEQGKPYSWPTSNRYSFPGTGVALCAAGNSAIILTDGFPYVATATVPEAASVSKIPGDTLAPCISKRGVVDIGSGAVFPSHDGLYVATTSGARNISEALYTMDEWQLLRPDTFKAGFSDQRYYAMHAGSDDAQAGIFMLHTKEPDSIIGFSEQVETLYGNPWDGRLYMAEGNKVYQWDADDSNRYLAYWQSKDYQLARPINFSVAQIHARFEDIRPVNSAILDANNQLLEDIFSINGEIACAEVAVYEVAGSALQLVPPQTQPTVQFTLVRDGQAVFTTLVDSNAPFRLPGGFTSDLYAIRLSSSIPVYSVNVAQGMNELRQAAV